MKGARFPLLLLTLVIFAFSCSTSGKDVKFSIFPDKTQKKAVKLVRTAKIYRDLDTILIADVMAYTPKIKRAFLNEIKKDGRIDEDQEAEILAGIEEKEKTQLEFIAGIYTGEKKWNDFDDVSSMWNVRLKWPDGTWVAPEEVSKMNLDEMPDSHLYPFLTEWKTSYKIVFKSTPEIRMLKTYNLRFTSILGEAKFVWKF